MTSSRSLAICVLAALVIGLAIRPADAMQAANAPDARLLHSAVLGDLRAAKAALDAGADPSTEGPEGLSALELADMRKSDGGSLSDRVPSMKAANTRLDIIKLLLDRGAKIRKVDKIETNRDTFGWAVTTDALHFSRYDVAERLLKAGAPADAVNFFSVLRAHPWTRKPREQRAWFERTLSDERVKGWLPQALCEAIDSPDAAYFVRRLLETGGDPNARTYTGHSPLTCAVVRGRPEVVKLLLAHGADPDIPYTHPKTAYLTSNIVYEGKTPLTLASDKRNAAIVAMLKKAGAHE